MATITPTQKNVPGGGSINTGATILTTWAAIGDADTCTGVRLPDFPDQTVEISGTFASQTVVMQGSNSSTTGADGTWFTLTDTLGNSISVTAAAMKYVLQNSLWIRPSATGGSSSSTNVYLMSRGSK